MYLSALRNEHKQLFLELALHLVAADGEYSEKEEAMMAAYCQEMLLDCEPPKTPRPLKDITDALSTECDEQEKRAVVFEAVGLAMTDGQYDESERTLIGSVQKSFGLPEDFGRSCETLLNEYCLSFLPDEECSSALSRMPHRHSFSKGFASLVWI